MQTADAQVFPEDVKKPRARIRICEITINTTCTDLHPVVVPGRSVSSLLLTCRVFVFVFTTAKSAAAGISHSLVWEK